jgi:hypothetical protein
MRLFLAATVGATALLFLPSASAKDFRPADLRVCNARRCVPLMNREVLPLLGSFYYGSAPLTRVRRPALGTPYYELRFRNGYVTGIVATRRLDRFLSYGVNGDRFVRNRWYALPSPLASEFRRLTVDLRAFRLTRTALAKSH